MVRVIVCMGKKGAQKEESKAEGTHGGKLSLVWKKETEKEGN